MYIDLHAHSRKHNIFIYGCESRKNSDKRLQEQVFPLMLHKNAADKVTAIKSTQNSVRALVLREFNLNCSSSPLKIASLEYKGAKKAPVELSYGCWE